MERYTGLTAGEPVAWGEATAGKYAVFDGPHVVYGEVTPFNYSFTYDFQLNAFARGTSSMPANAVAVPFKP